jgi:putative flippase GtrA
MGYTNFIGIALIGMGIVMGGMYVLTVFLAWNYLISRICIAIVTGLWNYLLNLHVNFKVAGKH